MSFSPINMTDLYNIFKNNKTYFLWIFSRHMLLLSSPNCLEPLLFILNACLFTGIFPTAWKHSIVVLPRTSNPSSPSSFRPITLPLLLSKILERSFLCNSHFFYENDIVPERHSDFRKHHSTTTSLLHLSILYWNPSMMAWFLYYVYFASAVFL